VWNPIPERLLLTNSPMNSMLVLKALVAGLAVTVLCMCEGGLNRATRDKAPTQSEVAPDPGSRSGSSPGSGVGRADLPPEQPIR